MKKLLSLLTVLAFALPMMALGTASDAYLNVTNYASIDQAGATVDGMETIYKYTQDGSNYWLTVSNYGVMKTDAAQNWFESTTTDADTGSQYTNAWTATDIFPGPSAYFGNNAAYSVKYKAPTKTQTFYVTFCSQVKQYANNRSISSNNYLLKMEIYECEQNADGTLTVGTTPIETVTNQTVGAGVITSSELDPEKIYKVVISNTFSYLYEIGFKTPGAFDGEITTPEAYDVTDLTYHQVYDTSNILCENFTCHWSACPGVKSYNLRVYPIQPEGLIFRDKFSNITANDVFEADSVDYQDLDGYPDHNGWSGFGLQGADGGIVINNGGQLVFSGSEADVSIYRFVKKFTIKFKAKAYDGDTNCVLRFANGSKNLTVDLTPEEKWYTVVVDREYPDYFSCLFLGGLFQNMTYEPGNNRAVITDFKVYFGDYSEPQNLNSPKYIVPAWSGDTTFVNNIPSDSTSFRFGYYINEEGNEQIDMTISIMDYAYYYYDVQAAYYGGITSDWSNQIPIWLTPWPEFLEDNDDDDPPVQVVGDVNGDGEVNSVDITILYNYLLNNDTEGMVNGDQNGDGDITSVDITVVYNALLGVDN